MLTYGWKTIKVYELLFQVSDIRIKSFRIRDILSTDLLLGINCFLSFIAFKLYKDYIIIRTTIFITDLIGFC